MDPQNGNRLGPLESLQDSPVGWLDSVQPDQPSRLIGLVLKAGLGSTRGCWLLAPR